MKAVTLWRAASAAGAALGPAALAEALFLDSYSQAAV